VPRGRRRRRNATGALLRGGGRLEARRRWPKMAVRACFGLQVGAKGRARHV